MTDRIDRGPIGKYEYLDYEDPTAVYRPYDERAPEVAARVAALIRDRMPDARVEHVGSSAIPGCHGKGIIDLLFMYPPGRLASARDTLDALGFQRQTGVDPFPEERPLRLGTFDHDGEAFRLHVHVIAEDDPEAREQTFFRDHLRENPELVEEYVAMKLASISHLHDDLTEDTNNGEVAPNIAYNAGKQPFIRRILAGLDRADDRVRGD